MPPFLDCIHLPPEGYVWPAKHPELPSPGDAVNWPNLRAKVRQDLVEFNKGTPKNLYHFEAGVYDKDGLDELSIAAKYIPLQKKVRNMLDIGAGGGSLGVLLKAKYNIQTIASAFADWPYCEYMTERGELCSDAGRHGSDAVREVLLRYDPHLVGVPRTETRGAVGIPP